MSLSIDSRVVDDYIFNGIVLTYNLCVQIVKVAIVIDSSLKYTPVVIILK